MSVGGLPVANTIHAYKGVSAALEIRDFIKNHTKERVSKNLPVFEIRMGIHTGPVLAAIVGTKIKRLRYFG